MLPDLRTGGSDEWATRPIFCFWRGRGSERVGRRSTIVGGLTAGIGAAIWMIAKHIYSEHPETGRKVLLTFILIWFVVDSLGSALAGAWFNAVLNTGLLIAMILPLVWVKDSPRLAPA